MSLVLLRLRWALLRRSVTRTTAHTVAFVIGCVLAGGALLLIGSGLVLLRDQSLATRTAAVVLLAGVTLAWPVMSVGAFGSDQALDPARLALLPLRPAALTRGLTLAAFVGLPGALTVGLALAQVVTWSAQPAPLVAALVATPVGLLTCVLLARVVTGALGRVISRRRGREVGAVIAALVGFVLLFVNLLATQQGGMLDSSTLVSFAEVTAWTPTGWAWCVPWEVADGRPDLAAIHLVLALLLVVGLAMAWNRLVALALTSPAALGSRRVGRGRILPVLLGAGPVAAIAGRRIRAWRRDPRLISAGVRIFAVPAVFVIQSVLHGGIPGSAQFAGLFVAVLCGLTLMSDLAFDGTPWWLHVASGVAGRDDRLGRVLASVVVFGPLVLLTFGVTWGLGQLSHPLAWLGVVLGGLCCSLGLAAYVGAITPGQAPRSGSNPFAAQSGGAAQGCLMAVISLVGPLVLIAPVLILYAATAGSPLGDGATAVLGLAWGVGVLVVGVALGGRHLERTAPEMLLKLRNAQI